MKISKLIEKLEKIQHKHGDLPIGHSVSQGYTSYTSKADGVDIKVRCPKTNPTVVIEAWSYSKGWYI